MPGSRSTILTLVLASSAPAGGAQTSGASRDETPTSTSVAPTPTADEDAKGREQDGEGDPAKQPERSTPITDVAQLSLKELLSFHSVPSVYTASRISEKANKAPGTVIVITKKDIRLRGYTFLEDILRDLPGMETQEYQFSEFGTLVPVRGVIGNNKIIVLLNGVRVNPPGGEAMIFRSDFSVRQAERVEIVYGPGSTLHGQDAISAVINVLTDTSSAASYRAEASGSWPLGGAGLLSISDRMGKVDVQAYVQYNNRELTDLSKSNSKEWDSYREVAIPKGTGVTPTRWERGLNGFVRFATDHSTLQLWHRQSSRSSSESMNKYFPKIADAVWSDMSTVVDLRNTVALGESVALETSLTFNRYEVDPESNYMWAGATQETWDIDHKYAIGSSASFEQKVTAEAGDSLQLVGGVSLSHYEIIPKTSFGTKPVKLRRDIAGQATNLSYWEVEGDPASRVDIPYLSYTKYEQLGLYLEGSWSPYAELKILLGARVDKNTRYSSSPIVPRASVAYELTENLDIKYVLTRAWVAPAPYYMYSICASSADYNIPNPELGPENATSNELSLSYHRNNLLVGLSGYYNVQSDLIIMGESLHPAAVIRDEVWVSEQVGAWPLKLTKNVNAGSSTGIGVDVYAKATLGMTSSWASYSLTDFQAKSPQGSFGLTGISRHNVRAGITLLPFDDLFATVSFRVRSTPENLDAEKMGTLKKELRWPHEVDLLVSYRLVENLDVFAVLRNVTNHQGAYVGWQSWAVPTEGFRATVGARYSH